MELDWTDCDRDAHRAALAAHGAPMQQHPTYGRVLARLGAVARISRLDPADGGAGFALTVGRRFGPLGLTALMRGPVAPPAAGGAALRGLARGAGILLATPEGGCRGRGLVPLLPPRQVALLPLAADAARQRAMLDGKWRNRLARGEGLGGLRLACRRPGPTDLDWLSRREAGQRRQKGYRGLPASFNRAWCAVDPDGARLYLASARGEPVAAALILVHPPWASYHIAWSDAPGRAHQAPRLILWQAMRDLAAAGITTLDLGLADPEGAPGLARFKLGTGARLHRLGPTLLVLPELTRRRSRSPVASRPDPRPTGGT